MSAPVIKPAVQLYRDLLRYGKQLKFTNKTFFKNRIRSEFEKNRNLESETDIDFNIKVNYTNSATFS